MTTVVPSKSKVRHIPRRHGLHRELYSPRDVLIPRVRRRTAAGRPAGKVRMGLAMHPLSVAMVAFRKEVTGR